jgi:hypothetical protein
MSTHYMSPHYKHVTHFFLSYSGCSKLYYNSLLCLMIVKLNVVYKDVIYYDFMMLCP